MPSSVRFYASSFNLALRVCPKQDHWAYSVFDTRRHPDAEGRVSKIVEIKASVLQEKEEELPRRLFAF